MPNPAETEPENNREQRLWRFGHAELDERSLELRVHGELAALEPKPLEVLLHLLHHAGEVVTKDELAEACWPRRILSDSVLTKTMSRLREVLQDDSQALIRTVHGYGYRLVASVTVSASVANRPEPALAFRPGDRLALRPNWLLVEQLGRGGSGEVWLLRQEHTGERRVFKFPLDVLALGSLKREITLSRLLAEPAAGRVARVLDWNLEQEPYFIEYEHAAGGNLLQWVEQQGGLKQLPLDQRIGLAVQMAETLAIAHSVGVLHKDLKPANVLVETSGPAPQLRLADFGSGGVLDPERLEALGITRLGFTRTLAVADTGSGTPMYLAPEILAGQPATVQGDIYALGVMLYQLVAGDFRKPLAAGWELEFDDEILREDIADAAAGDARRRLADAGALAERLRNLEGRRQARARQQQEQVRAEAERLQLERLRARRKWMFATIGTLVVGTVISLGLYFEAQRARDQATRSATTSQAVAGFLGRDIFGAINTMQKPPAEWTVLDLLNSASGEIDQRFVEQPEVAAQLHAAVGEAYLTLEAFPSSDSHMRRAFELARRQSDSSPALLDAAAKLLFHDYLAGHLADTIESYVPVLEGGERDLGAAHPSVQKLRKSLSWGHAMLGHWNEALRLKRLQIAQFSAGPGVATPEYIDALRSLGCLLTDVADYDEAEQVLRDAGQRYAQLPDASEFAQLPLQIAMIDLLVQRGRYADAAAQIDVAEKASRRWTSAESSQYPAVLAFERGLMLAEQGQFSQAEAVLRRVLKQYAPAPGEKADERWLVLEALGLGQHHAGQLAEAESSYRAALQASLLTNGAGHPLSLRIRVALADVLRERGRLPEARTLVAGIDSGVLSALPSDHPIFADYRRVQGLLLAAEGQRSEAVPALADAVRIYQIRLGAAHWRTRRAAADLAALDSPAPD